MKFGRQLEKLWFYVSAYLCVYPYILEVFNDDGTHIGIQYFFVTQYLCVTMCVYVCVTVCVCVCLTLWFTHFDDAVR